MRATSRTRTSLALAATALIGLAACGGDDDDGDAKEGPVELQSAGAEAGRIELPGSAEVGQTGSASVLVDLTLAISGAGIDQEVPVGIRFDYDSEIVEADADGYVAESVVTGSDVIEAPKGTDPDELGIEDLVGVRFRQAFGADGTGGDLELVNDAELSDDQRAAFDDFGGDLESTSFEYPAEPVGVGATWTSVKEVASEGFDVEVTYHYELTAIDGDEYAIDISYDEDIDQHVDADGVDADVTGTLVGGGTSTGSVSNPLATAASITQDFDVDFDSDDQSMTMVMKVAVQVAPQVS